MSNWKNKFAFKSREFVTQTVGGKEFRFYPNRMNFLSELMSVSKQVASAISILMSDKSSDTSVTTERITDGAGGYIDKTVIGAVTPEMVTLRSKERDEAIEKIAEAFGDIRNRLHLGFLLMDSLADEFPYDRERSPAEVEEFLYGDNDGYTGISLPHLIEMVQGWIKANAKQFGSVGEKMAAKAQEHLSGLKGSSPEKPDMSSGSGSKTPSSQQSEEALI